MTSQSHAGFLLSRLDERHHAVVLYLVRDRAIASLFVGWVTFSASYLCQYSLVKLEKLVVDLLLNVDT